MQAKDAVEQNKRVFLGGRSRIAFKDKVILGCKSKGEPEHWG